MRRRIRRASQQRWRTRGWRAGDDAFALDRLRLQLRFEFKRRARQRRFIQNLVLPLHVPVGVGRRDKSDANSTHGTVVDSSMSSGGAGFSASRLVGSAAEFSVISLLFLASIYVAYQVRNFSSRAMQCFGLNRMPLRGAIAQYQSCLSP